MTGVQTCALPILLRGTVRTLLPDFDVYLTDWHNARDVPIEDGHFGFDEHVAHMMRFIEHLGPGAHVLAVATGGATLDELKRHTPDWAVTDLREVSAKQICRRLA